MGSGIGTSKEDKTRKRRSLPHEKKKQADKILGKNKVTTIAALFTKLGSKAIAKQLGKEGYTVKKTTKKNPHKD